MTQVLCSIADGPCTIICLASYTFCCVHHTKSVSHRATEDLSDNSNSERDSLLGIHVISLIDPKQKLKSLRHRCQARANQRTTRNARPFPTDLCESPAQRTAAKPFAMLQRSVATFGIDGKELESCIAVLPVGPCARETHAYNCDQR